MCLVIPLRTLRRDDAILWKNVDFSFAGKVADFPGNRMDDGGFMKILRATQKIEHASQRFKRLFITISMYCFVYCNFNKMYFLIKNV